MLHNCRCSRLVWEDATECAYVCIAQSKGIWPAACALVVVVILLSDDHDAQSQFPTLTTSATKRHLTRLTCHRFHPLPGESPQLRQTGGTSAQCQGSAEGGGQARRHKGTKFLAKTNIVKLRKVSSATQPTVVIYGCGFMCMQSRVQSACHVRVAS